MAYAYRNNINMIEIETIKPLHLHIEEIRLLEQLCCNILTRKEAAGYLKNSVIPANCLIRVKDIVKAIRDGLYMHQLIFGVYDEISESGIRIRTTFQDLPEETYLIHRENLYRCRRMDEYSFTDYSCLPYTDGKIPEYAEKTKESIFTYRFGLLKEYRVFDCLNAGKETIYKYHYHLNGALFSIRKNGREILRRECSLDGIAMTEKDDTPPIYMEMEEQNISDFCYLEKDYEEVFGNIYRIGTDEIYKRRLELSLKDYKKHGSLRRKFPEFYRMMRIHGYDGCSVHERTTHYGTGYAVFNLYKKQGDQKIRAGQYAPWNKIIVDAGGLVSQTDDCRVYEYYGVFDTVRYEKSYEYPENYYRRGYTETLRWYFSMDLECVKTEWEVKCGEARLTLTYHKGKEQSGMYCSMELPCNRECVYVEKDGQAEYRERTPNDEGIDRIWLKCLPNRELRDYLLKKFGELYDDHARKKMKKLIPSIEEGHKKISEWIERTDAIELMDLPLEEGKKMWKNAKEMMTGIGA